jgi:hypothetical protein
LTRPPDSDSGDAFEKFMTMTAKNKKFAKAQCSEGAAFQFSEKAMATTDSKRP